VTLSCRNYSAYGYVALRCKPTNQPPGTPTVGPCCEIIPLNSGFTADCATEKLLLFNGQNGNVKGPETHVASPQRPTLTCVDGISRADAQAPHRSHHAPPALHPADAGTSSSGRPTALSELPHHNNQLENQLLQGLYSLKFPTSDGQTHWLQTIPPDALSKYHIFAHPGTVGMSETLQTGVEQQFLQPYAVQATVVNPHVPTKSVKATGNQFSSHYRGVTRHRQTGKWEAHFWDSSYVRPEDSKKANDGKKVKPSARKRKRGRQIYIGGYHSEVAAAQAYDKVAIALMGEEVQTNVS
jgi:hypothetical protein